jgi:hypothetical protein
MMSRCRENGENLPVHWIAMGGHTSKHSTVVGVTGVDPTDEL